MRREHSNINWNSEAKVYDYLSNFETQNFITGKVLEFGANSVLDIGSYKGALLGSLKAAGYMGNYTGVEVAAKPILEAIKTFGESSLLHRFIHADAFNITLPESDFVAVGGVMFYLTDYEGFAFIDKLFSETRCKVIMVSDVKRCNHVVYRLPGIQSGEFKMPIEGRNSERKFIILQQ